MKYLTKNIIFIIISIVFISGCNIDIDDNSETIEGSWASRDNFYDGCYAYYTFGSENDSDSGVYRIVKSKVLHGDATAEDSGTYTVDYKLNTITFVSVDGETKIVEFDLEDEKLFLEGDALHNFWKASRIELRKL